MKKALYVVFAFLLIWLVGNGSIGLGGGSHPSAPSHYSSDSPWASAPADDGSDCDVENAPDERALEFGRHLCDAAASAEAEADCLGSWQPPDPISARQFCLEVQRRGCGDPNRDCTEIPDDMTYYTHHNR